MPLRRALKTLLPENATAAVQYYLASRRKDRKRTQSRRAAQALLKEHTAPSLELGATPDTGSTGWVTVDMDEDADLWWDLSEPLPFPDGSVTRIYSSHLLEHFYYYSLLHLLEECKRILVEGGSFRACVPNARLYIDAYKEIDSGFDPEEFLTVRKAYHGDGRIDYLNYIAYMRKHHKHMFDEENLVNILEKVGFQDVRLSEFDPSFDSEKRRRESIYATATKGAQSAPARTRTGRQDPDGRAGRQR